MLDFGRQLQLWQSAAVFVACAKPGPLQAGHDLAERLRGAWGQALRRRAGGDPAAAELLAACFRSSAKGAPAPMLPAVDMIGHRLIFQIRLFGHWRYQYELARLALIEALERGLTVRPESRMRVSLAIEASRVAWQNHIPGLRDSLEALVLEMATPLVIRRRQAMAGRMLGLLDGLRRRVTAISGTMGIELGTDDGPWQDWMRGLLFDDSGLFPIRAIPRRSSRRRGQIRYVNGLMGRLVITGDTAPLLPLVLLGQLTGAGGQTALGCGRYRLLSVPHPIDDSIRRHWGVAPARFDRGKDKPPLHTIHPPTSARLRHTPNITVWEL